MQFCALQRQHLPAISALCKAERWPSFSEDPERAWRALTAPGVTTVVAVDGGRVVGFVQMQSDGQIQAHLSLVLVAADRRREGIATRLVRAAFKQCGAERVDVVSDRAEEFYRSLAGKEWHGFRIYPQ
jgi:ribosomal protein S18 acetylase RimI-like enzyme